MRTSRCPGPVTGSDAECAFAVVHRGLTAEGGPHEPGLPTFVSRRFVDCSDGTVGLAVLHDGLLEYEVVDDGRELALTLLRATGYLSRAEPSLRPNPAGPLLPVHGAQLQKPLAFDYALLPHTRLLVATPTSTRRPTSSSCRSSVARAGDGDRATAGQALSVSGAVVSALTREAGGVVDTLLQPAARPGHRRGLERDGEPVSGWVVDLLGAPLEPFDGRDRPAPRRDRHRSGSTDPGPCDPPTSHQNPVR